MSELTDTDREVLDALDAQKQAVDVLVAQLLVPASSLLATLKARHNLLDALLAMNIARDRSFLPSRSTVWPLLLQGRNAIEKLEAQGQPLPLPQEGTA